MMKTTDRLVNIWRVMGKLEMENNFRVVYLTQFLLLIQNKVNINYIQNFRFGYNKKERKFQTDKFHYLLFEMILYDNIYYNCLLFISS